MQTNSKPSSSVKPLGGLNVAQKLELYQIIAFAEDGDFRSVIERAKQMLAAAKETPLKLSDSQASLLRQQSVAEILAMVARAQ